MAFIQDENRMLGVNLNNRRNKLRENTGSHGKQRAVLGNLSNVQTTTRVQPYRAAKLPLKEKLVPNQLPDKPHHASTLSHANVQSQSHLSRVAQPAPFSIFTEPGSGDSSKAFKSRPRTRSGERLSNIHSRDVSEINSSGYNSAICSQSQVANISSTSCEAMNESLLCTEDVEEEFYESPMLMNVSAPANVQVEESPSRAFERVVLCMSPYEKEVHRYLLDLEMRMKPKANFMQKQPDINATMRLILVDWLIEVGIEYKQENETLFLAVAYVDRFLSLMSVLRGKLQLVGAASMFIASKYEEIYPPELNEFVYITDNTYSKKQMLKMEMLILKVLQFDMTIPTSLMFLHRYLSALNIPQDSKLAHLATFLLELSLLHVNPYVNYLSSLKAASALAVALFVLNNQLWPSEMGLCCEYSLLDVRECMASMVSSWRDSSFSPQKAVRQKYQEEKYGCVSKLSAPLMLIKMLSPVGEGT